MRELPPPLSVTRPLPSSTVSFVNVIGAVTVIVIGAAPQLNTIVPPPVAACCSAAAVQLAGVPSPTVAVGAETSASAGRLQIATGVAASVVPPSSPLPSLLLELPPHAQHTTISACSRPTLPASHDYCHELASIRM